MNWEPETATLELTARNIQVLLDKLDDPRSKCTIERQGIYVTAVESAGAAEAVAAPGTVPLTRVQLAELATEGATVRVGAVRVVAVPDDAHYTERSAGVMYMPSSDEYR